MAINTLVFAYAAWNHKYPPLRAKNMPLIAVLYVSMLFWFLGTIGTNFNLPGVFDFKSSCILFASWFRVLLGIFLFIHINVFRLYTYLRIFREMKRMRVHVYVIGAVVYLAIIVAYGIPVTVLRNKLTVQFVPELGTCIYGTVFIELSFAIVWMGWIAVVVVTVVARNINTSFNEYKEMVLIIILSSITLTYETIAHNIVRDYVLYRWSRTLSTYMEYLSSQSALFILLGVPVYNCIFHRESYRREFFEKMRADGMVARYEYMLANTTDSTAVVSTNITAHERAAALDSAEHMNTQSGNGSPSSPEAAKVASSSSPSPGNDLNV
ncbi:hypothetical protein LPJ59_001522 [Coemansia sp. RSA 2399]|nr:hypothetical protein LPJ59_001522 [Coemansia sp. RSA 2399]KAJ1905107.1 hypothetical protein LPJ81_002109 [Coemansia sp. IMI 209127]